MTNLGSQGCLYLLTEISISHCEFSSFFADFSLRLSCLYHGSTAMSGYVEKLNIIYLTGKVSSFNFL